MAKPTEDTVHITNKSITIHILRLSTFNVMKNKKKQLLLTGHAQHYITVLPVK